MSKRKVVVLTGAGISAESGIQTFRGAGGLWEGFKVEDVASPEGWYRNRDLVLNFYNERRAKLLKVKPNDAHFALADLEEKFDVTIVTQNIDDLHERGGSSNVVHLHGELLKARSTVDPGLVYEWTKDIKPGDLCEEGSQLRPHIVWFGEAVPMLETAIKLSENAEFCIVIGTSMQVYPAAGLIRYVHPAVKKFFIDPNPAVEASEFTNLTILAEKATTGVRKVVDQLLARE